MKIAKVGSWVESFALSRPYTIAFRSISAVDNVVVEIHGSNGLVGRGVASPERFVTGETIEACQSSLQEDALEWLVGQDVLHLPALIRTWAERNRETPAAQAAVDMALHDLWAQFLGKPLVELLGRAHHQLPTSITIGIKGVEETLAEAEEYVGRGFRILKVKIGRDRALDEERLRRLRQRFQDLVTIRVDANQGYRVDELEEFFRVCDECSIEFVEQPVTPETFDGCRELPESRRKVIAADESMQRERDALRIAVPPSPSGILNIKLMKCGGVAPALRIACIAEAAELSLMWGCMDESIVGIAAALHAAFASPATKYLDLDGSLDLARDWVRGGFELRDGCLRTLDRPGLGVSEIA